MARRVSWSRPALEDLDQIAGYIALDSKYYSATFVREVRDAARTLAQLANRGRMVPELGALWEREGRPQ